MKKLFQKYPVFKYILESYVKSFLFVLVFFSVAFAILKFTGIYAWLERALDLKYNSLFVLVPLYGSVALAVLCLFIGILLYFYKYKRSSSKSDFYITFSNILNDKQINPK